MERDNRRNRYGEPELSSSTRLLGKSSSSKFSLLTKSIEGAPGKPSQLNRSISALVKSTEFCKHAAKKTVVRSKAAGCANSTLHSADVECGSPSDSYRQLKAAHEEIDAYALREKKLEADCAYLASKNAELTDLLEVQNHALQKAQQSEAKLQVERTNLEHKFHELEISRSVAVESREIVQKLIGQVGMTMSHERSELSELKLQLSIREEQCETLLEQLHEKQQLLSKVQMELAHANTEKHELLQQNNQLLSRQLAEKQRLESILFSLSTAVPEDRDLVQLIDIVAVQLAELQTQFEQANTSNDQLQAKIESLEQHSEGLEEQLSWSDNRCEELKKQLEADKSALLSLKQQASVDSKTLQSFHEQAKHDKAKLQKLCQELQEERDAVQNLKAQVQHCQSKMAQLQAMVDKGESRLLVLQLQADQDQLLLQELRGECDSNAVLASSLKEQLSDKESTLQHLHSATERTHESLVAEVDDLRERLRVQSSEQLLLKTELKFRSAQLDQLRTNEADLLNKIASHQKSFKELLNQVDLIRDERNLLSQENARLMGRLEELLEVKVKMERMFKASPGLHRAFCATSNDVTSSPGSAQSLHLRYGAPGIAVDESDGLQAQCKDQEVNVGSKPALLFPSLLATTGAAHVDPGEVQDATDGVEEDGMHMLAHCNGKDHSHLCRTTCQKSPQAGPGQRTGAIIRNVLFSSAAVILGALALQHKHSPL